MLRTLHGHARVLLGILAAIPCGGLLLGLALWALASPVRANPELDRALSASLDAEFDLALGHFELALEQGGLTRTELLLLLGERALVEHALQQGAKLELDLRYLAALDPTRDLGHRAPPSLVARWQ